MTSPSTWHGTDAYEAYMGRWSRPLAQLFLTWFAAPTSASWLDVGCGTGALTAAILATTDPSSVLGIDPSEGFISTAKTQLADARAAFEVADARAIPVSSGSYDAVVSGLVLNHIPDPVPAVAEMVRVTRPGGCVGAYVWDYLGEMQLLRLFWESAAATIPDASTHDPRSHYDICHPAPLAATLREAGLFGVTVDSIDLPMAFRDFDDFWLPHTLIGPGLAQRYVATLPDDQKTALREHLRTTLPTAPDGTISIVGRALAVRGTK